MTSHYRYGLRTRLLALVLAPALLLALLGGAAALRQHRAATRLAEVRQEVGVLAQLTTLRSVLLEARAPVEVGVRAQALGIDRDTALRLLGLEQFSSSDLDQVVVELERLPADARPFRTADVDQLGHAADAGADLTAIDRFDRLDTAASEKWERRFADLRTRVVSTGSTSLDHRMDDLEDATMAGSAAGTMVTKLADYWFSYLASSSRAAPARSELAVASQQFDRAIDDLETSTDPKVEADAKHIAADKPGTPLDRAIDDAVAGKAPEPFANGVDVKLITATFTSSFQVFGTLFNLINGRSDRLQAAVTVLADDATRNAAITFGGVLLAIAVMVVISLLIASTFEQPLSRLIEGTRRVGSGDLSLEPLPTNGPAEIGEASAAFNDVVVNLRLLEGKVDALANGNLEDPWLDVPLPGQLGDTMDRSIQLLSDSIADRASLQERLAYQATHDALTLLPNRPGALEALDGAMARSRRTGSRLAVAFLDLDGFKLVNDTYGHQTGDDVLREVARRLDAEARAGDFCARLGGDEFVIIAENVAGDAGALALGTRVAARIAEPMEVGGQTVTVGASIGVAFRNEGEEGLQLLARADEASYRAKRGGGPVELY
ncbi:diguanylate cyclase domain-containing protein [Aquihabitans sp. McL0605]|uniref:diguanylate cyclase domain-containing protein n=1 Tax=Aquihabitans sp. McL0605 TaxID=3415671 RepID=UPI003CF7410F